jgi:membrane protease YdiL (CAAX protease family)
VENNSTWAPSPASLTTWPAESFRVPLTILAAVGAIVVVIGVSGAYFTIAYMLGEIDPRHPENLPTTQLLLVQLVAYLPLALYLLVVIPPVAQMSLRQLGVRRPTLGELGAGVVGTVAMWLVVVLASSAIEALTHRHDTEAAIQLLKNVRTPVEKVSFIAVAVLFAPLVEELAFRVFVFNAFRRWTPLWVAAVSSGILFGLVHAAAPAQVVTVGIPLTLGGIVLALVYARTGCYWSNVVTHGLFNAITVVAYFVFGVKS